jgi:hypothetical protein
MNEGEKGTRMNKNEERQERRNQGSRNKCGRKERKYDKKKKERKRQNPCLITDEDTSLKSSMNCLQFVEFKISL